MDMSFLNPFDEIIETKISPHARTLRTSFSQKCSDAFEVIFGQYDETLIEKKSHVGVLDWISLLLFPAITYLEEKAQKSDSIFLNILGGLLFIFVHLPLHLAKTIVAIGLFIISLPIIGIVHFFSEYVAGGADMKDKLLKLPSSGNFEQGMLAVEIDQSTSNVNVRARTSDEILTAHQKVDSQISTENINAIVSPVVKDQREIAFFLHNDSKDFSKGERKKDDYAIGFFVINDPKCPNINEIQKAAVKLNWGGLTSKLEQSEEGKKVLSSLVRPLLSNQMQRY